MAAANTEGIAAPGGRGRTGKATLARLRSLPLTLLLAAWLIWLFDAINNLAPVRQRLAERNGERILDLEHALHLAPEHALNRWLAGHRLFGEIVVFWYENVHVAVTLAVLGWLWWRRGDLLGTMGATLVMVNLIALAVFWSFPVAPPRMLPGGYVDSVAAVHHLPVWRLGATAIHSNQLSSMPSLHIAWATWSSIAVWRMSDRRWLRLAALIYPFLTTFAVMATANHYLADAVAAAAITVVVFGAVNRSWSEGWPVRRPRPARLV
jgi:hypothetical protein